MCTEVIKYNPKGYLACFEIVMAHNTNQAPRYCYVSQYYKQILLLAKFLQSFLADSQICYLLNVSGEKPTLWCLGRNKVRASEWSGGYEEMWMKCEGMKCVVDLVNYGETRHILMYRRKRAIKSNGLYVCKPNVNAVIYRCQLWSEHAAGVTWDAVSGCWGSSRQWWWVRISAECSEFPDHNGHVFSCWFSAFLICQPFGLSRNLHPNACGEIVWQASSLDVGRCPWMTLLLKDYVYSEMI